MHENEQLQNSGVEFHDSEISSIETDGADAIVKFSAAYVHRSSGRPGIDSGAGFLQALELICIGVQSFHKEDGCVGELSGGFLAKGKQQMCLVPIPYETSEECTLELLFTNGSRAHIRASGIILRPTGDARFVESFSC
jgi:hypothetical protein